MKKIKKIKVEQKITDFNQEGSTSMGIITMFDCGWALMNAAQKGDVVLFKQSLIQWREAFIKRKWKEKSWVKKIQGSLPWKRKKMEKIEAKAINSYIQRALELSVEHGHFEMLEFILSCPWLDHQNPQCWFQWPDHVERKNHEKLSENNDETWNDKLDEFDNDNGKSGFKQVWQWIRSSLNWKRKLRNVKGVFFPDSLLKRSLIDIERAVQMVDLMLPHTVRGPYEVHDDQERQEQEQGGCFFKKARDGGDMGSALVMHALHYHKDIDMLKKMMTSRVCAEKLKIKVHDDQENALRRACLNQNKEAVEWMLGGSELNPCNHELRGGLGGAGWASPWGMPQNHWMKSVEQKPDFYLNNAWVIACAQSNVEIFKILVASRDDKENKKMNLRDQEPQGHELEENIMAMWWALSKNANPSLDMVSALIKAWGLPPRRNGLAFQSIQSNETIRDVIRAFDEKQELNRTIHEKDQEPKEREHGSAQEEEEGQKEKNQPAPKLGKLRL